MGEVTLTDESETRSDEDGKRGKLEIGDVGKSLLHYLLQGMMIKYT